MSRRFALLIVALFALTIFADPPAPKGGVVDLLGDLDGKLVGKWKLKEGVLTGTDDHEKYWLSKQPLLMEGPVSSYTITMTANRKSGDKAFGILMPLGADVGGMILFGTLDGQHGEIHGIKDSMVKGDRAATFTPNKDHLIKISVNIIASDADIVVTLDDKPFLHGRNKRDRLKADLNWSFKDSRVLGLAIRNGDTVEFRDVKLTPTQN